MCFCGKVVSSDHKLILMFFKEVEHIEASESLSADKELSHITTTVWLLISSLLRHLTYSAHESTAIKTHSLASLQNALTLLHRKEIIFVQRVMSTPETFTMQSMKDEKQYRKTPSKILNITETLWNILIHHSIMGKKRVMTALLWHIHRT